MRFPFCLLAFLMVLTAVVTADDWRDVRKDALRDARSEKSSERESAFEPLRSQDHRDAVDFLVKFINSPSADLQVKRHARDVLATFRSEESRGQLYRILRSDPDKSFLLLEAFAGMEDERGVEIGKLAIKAGVSKRSGGAPIIAAGIRCLASTGKPGETTVASIIKRTADDCPITVRKAAVDSLLKIRTPEAVETLVSLVDDAAVGKRARHLMVQLAGEDVGASSADWQAWLKAEGEALPESDPVSEQKADELIAAKTAAAIEAGEAPPEITFYGVPIEGKKIVFVMDASSSMKGYPLERLKEECRALVGQLPETHQFALVFYPKNENFPAELHAADDETKKKAYEFINKRQVIRGTPTGDAMEFAYKRYVVGQNVDTIYLLSDGRPTKPIPDVIERIDNLNIGLYVNIHTIFIGEVPAADAVARDPNAPIKSGAEFLREVARRHEGKFSIVEAGK